MATTISKSSARSLRGLNSAVVADVIEVLARHNPRLSETALAATGRVVAAVTAATARLAADQQRQIVADEHQLAQAVEVVVAALVVDPSTRLVPLSVSKSVEVSQGAGLPAPIDLEEGRRRLADFAHPARLEEWTSRDRKDDWYEAIDPTRLADTRRCDWPAEGRAQACVSIGAVRRWAPG